MAILLQNGDQVLLQIGDVLLEQAAAAGGTEYDADGLLGQANSEGFAPTLTLQNEIQITTILGEVNVAGFEGSFQRLNEVQFTSLLGEVGAEGFAATISAGLPAYEATALLGQATAEGFPLSLGLYRSASPETAEINAEGFSSNISLQRRAQIRNRSSEIEGFAATVTVDFVPAVSNISPELGIAHAIGYAPSVTRDGLEEEEVRRTAGSGLYDEEQTLIEQNNEIILKVVQMFLDDVA